MLEVDSRLVLQCHQQGSLSVPFNIERGICQGSVLSPTLFNLIIDPLLLLLREKSLGLSINGLFLGAFAHADDIRTLASSIDDSIQQTDTVRSFAASRGLQLCTKKCTLILSRGKAAHSRLLANTNYLPVVDSAKCLGIWWKAAPYSRESIKERITKARAAFYSHGQLGAFHGLLNPLSSRSLIEACIIPVLMYGSESWILNSSLLAML